MNCDNNFGCAECKYGRKVKSDIKADFYECTKGEREDGNEESRRADHSGKSLL